METKDTLSSCSYSEEQQMQQIQDKAKKSAMYLFKKPSFTPSSIFTRQLKRNSNVESGFKTFWGAFATLLCGTALKEQDTSSRSGNDAHADDANIRPIYDEESMAEVQTSAKINVFTIGQQQTEQPEFNNEETTVAKNIEYNNSLIAKNDDFKAQLQEKGYQLQALKNEVRKLTGNSMNTKFAKSSILGKRLLQPRENQPVVRQPNAFKSERPRISKQRFASQVDVNNDLSKSVTTHYLPKEREFAIEAKKKTQESYWNSEPSVMPSARSQSTANGSKPNPRINN
ncbi:hypothetical protein Tco_1482291 [Tanacetum coccineum]